VATTRRRRKTSRRHALKVQPKTRRRPLTKLPQATPRASRGEELSSSLPIRLLMPRVRADQGPLKMPR
jgi:hypothetical protein